MKTKLTKIVAFTLCMMLTAGMLCSSAAASDADSNQYAGLYLMYMNTVFTEAIEEISDYFRPGTYSITTSECWGEDTGLVHFDLDEYSVTINGLGEQKVYRFNDEDGGFMFMCLLFVKFDQDDACGAGVKFYGTSDGFTRRMYAEDIKELADAVREKMDL